MQGEKLDLNDKISSTYNFSNPKTKEEALKILGDDKKIEEFKGLNISTAEIMDIIQKRRGTNFSDTNSELLSTDISKRLLKQFKKFYNEAPSLIQESGFHPFDNKLAKLLILSNGGTVHDEYIIGEDGTKEELIKRDKEFQEIWNENFFNIEIKNPGKIKISHEINNNKYISITKWDKEN